ncbi:MAG: deoxyribose-phosphate aldolase [Clostridia bacterium]
MDINQILAKVDHTQLAQGATFEDIKTLCDDAIKFGCASVCIAPSYVKSASEYVKAKIKICTVIGFPNGYNTTAVKCFETKNAIENGADEIDMVINIGLVKDKKYDEIEDEIKQIKAVCGDKILKVIIETCLLTDEEKIKMCEIVSSAKADFIKTSTGFSTAGATREDIKLFADNVASHVAIKAAGGIANLDDASDMLALGATRLGTSRIVKLAKNEESNGY